MYKLFTFIIVLIPSIAFSHPVSFKDGFGIMPGYMGERQDLELNYSYTQNNAVAFNTINIDDKKDVTFYLPQFNHKFYRKNEVDSQTNLYGSFGLGASSQRGDNEAAGLVAIQADYETRRIYTLFNAEHLQTEGDGLNRLRYRLGAAPYLANFEELNTWLILQVDYTPELSSEWTFTPMVRLFYSNYLIEAGVSLDGEPFLAGIFHFNGGLMRGIIILLTLLLTPGFLFAEEIKASVKGMVCSFCAQGIRKNFLKLSEVESATPDLEKKIVVIITKEGKTLSDEEVKNIIVDAGYEVADIERVK